MYSCNRSEKSRKRTAESDRAFGASPLRVGLAALMAAFFLYYAIGMTMPAAPPQSIGTSVGTSLRGVVVPTNNPAVRAEKAAQVAWVTSLEATSTDNPIDKINKAQEAAKAAYMTEVLAAANPDPPQSEAKMLLQRVKEAGLAGAISYAGWELAFWAASVPVCLVAYYGVTGHLPDLSDQDDLTKLGTEAFAFVNLARFAVPLRIGLALGTTPWVQANIVDRFGMNK